MAYQGPRSPVVTAAVRGLLLAVLLLDPSGYCYTLDSSSISNSVDKLTEELRGERRAMEEIATGFMSFFRLLIPDHLTCDKGWHSLGSSCYFISEETKDWRRSLESCKAMTSDFVKITSDEEYNFLRDLVKGQNVYVGLNDIAREGVFIWTDGSVQPMIKSWWVPREPNNGGSPHYEEDCVNFTAADDDNRFSDTQCSNYRRYICERPALPE